MGGNLPPEEHLLLDDYKYVADVLYDFKNAKPKDTQSKLLFKKRMFRETDETITEPQFVNLSYVQVPPPPSLHILHWVSSMLALLSGFSAFHVCNFFSSSITSMAHL